MKSSVLYSAPMCPLKLDAEDGYLTGISFNASVESDNDLADNAAVLGETVKWLDMYFEGQIPGFTPPLRLDTTPFRKKVYSILITIPYGETLSYGEIARRLREGGENDSSRSSFMARAVGGAVGHNPIGIIIPCHRVIGADGSLTGFAGGLECKKFLLELERRK